MRSSRIERRDAGSRLHRAVVAVCTGAALATGVLVTGTGVAQAATCANFEYGGNHPGFSNTNTGYGDSTMFRRDIKGTTVVVGVDGAGNCQAPGNQFVRAKARLWDGTGAVVTYLEEYKGGEGRRITGTGFRQDPTEFFTPGYSRIYNAAGKTVRGCARFLYRGADEVRCSPWVGVPVNAD